MSSEAVKPGQSPEQRLRVGVTGHRRLPDDPRLAARVRDALALIRSMTPGGREAGLTVVSPLAEGADRVVAREVLKEGSAMLEVPLPVPCDAYLDDFDTARSKEEFLALLARATLSVTMAPARTREEMYEAAGRYVVDHSQAIIAIWDGRPSRGQGGTAEIVELARRQRMPVVWVLSEQPFSLKVDTGTGEWRELVPD
ncbi:MAG TPA: hypothetical protein VKX16_09280 [Chloroflexota bacterium]|nr:hypothetical protein [Chloroflexota bacterium]